jgi:hypothetical protein
LSTLTSHGNLEEEDVTFRNLGQKESDLGRFRCEEEEIAIERRRRRRRRRTGSVSFSEQHL